MSRFLQLLVLLLSAAAFIALVLAPGCSDECNRAGDCESGSVCYKGICTPISAEYVRCDTDIDCDTSGQFVCQASRCIIKVSSGGAFDSGVLAEAGPGMDAMMNPDAMGNPDATVFPDAIVNPDATEPDAMDMDAEPADTSTIGADM